MRYSTGSGVAGAGRLAIAVLALVTLSAACATRNETTDTSSATGESDEPVVDYVGSMELEPSRGLPCTVVTITGEGLAAGQAYDLTWGSAEGSWDIRGDAGEEYHGRVFTPTVMPLGSVTADGAGNLAATFEVPEDFGFVHDVRLVDSD